MRSSWLFAFHLVRLPRPENVLGCTSGVVCGNDHPAAMIGFRQSREPLGNVRLAVVFRDYVRFCCQKCSGHVCREFLLRAVLPALAVAFGDALAIEPFGMPGGTDEFAKKGEIVIRRRAEASA